jgi:hypothetical protein
MSSKVIFLFSILFIFITASCKKNAADAIDEIDANLAKERARLAKIGFPEITFDNLEYNFGTVNEGDKVEGYFEFTNTGKSDLIITAAKASCGCTVPEYDKDKPLKPGEKGKLKFVFDTSGKPENQNKSISVYCNTKRQQETVNIKGYVKPNPNSLYKH